MKLKFIEILGFKSFAEKTRLEFTSPISCIVGPNGCGKSNVVDSIRWCIGEMSWKSLRSPSMVDIIFNGTQKRPSQSMAEVNLVFDNITRKLPVDFDEVSVSRKIYRSGESEYFLNKVQCRLKDIRDLFLDTGIGSGGYAIIDQGGVNFILKAKPEERRELFEEAAGVAKYKSKREEAIKKLEKVDADLARLSDTVTLISGQIKALDSQARKARAYKRLKEQLRDSEIAILVKNACETEDKSKNQQENLKPIQENISAKQIAIDKLEGEISALNLNLTYKQNELNDFNEKTADCKYRIGKLEGDISNFENLAAEMTRQIETLTTEDEADNKRMRELDLNIEKLKKELHTLESQIKPVEDGYNHILSDIKEKENKILEIEQSLEKLNGELMDFSDTELEISRKIAFDQSEIRHIEENLINLEKERAKKSQTLENLRSELEKLETELQNLNAILQKINQKIYEAQVSINKSTETKLKLQQDIMLCKSKNAALSATLELILKRKNKDPYQLGISAVLSARIDGIMGIFADCLKIDKQDKIYCEEIFGQFMDSLICRDKLSADKAIEFLKSKGGMRAKFLILDAFGEKSAKLDDKDAQVKSRLDYPDYLEKVVDYLFSRHNTGETGLKFWVTGGDDNITTADNYWGREQEIRGEIIKNEKTNADLENRLADVESETEKTETRIYNLKQSSSDETVKRNTLSGFIESKKESLSLAEESIRLIEGEKKNLLGQKNLKEQSLKDTKHQILSLGEKRSETKSKLENIKNQKLSFTADISGVRSRLENASKKLNELRNEKTNLTSDSKSLEMHRQNILSSLERRAQQRESNHNRISEFGENKLSCQAKLSDKRNELKNSEVHQTRIAEELSALKSEYDEKSLLLNNEKKVKSELDLKAGQLQAEIKNSQRQMSEICRNLSENWNTDIEQSKLKYRNFEIDYDKVKNIRRRLDNMGPVNMTAPEEYDVLSSKHSFLTSQISDLENAKSDLKSAIDRINFATRENFRHTFEKVRENFQKIYRVLFEGGEADLLLTQPDNILESGVEIITCPPGKKTQNISSLSGGEQALTALSLLFSFFVVNPSPFCILDEADAPLDEANIDRFVNLLRQFVKNTQFIIVTHNKRTMESADILYGITMQESGVSKVVSVELEGKQLDKEKIPESSLAVA